MSQHNRLKFEVLGVRHMHNTVYETEYARILLVCAMHISKQKKREIIYFCHILWRIYIYFSLTLRNFSTTVKNSLRNRVEIRFDLCVFTETTFPGEKL